MPAERKVEGGAGLLVNMRLSGKKVLIVGGGKEAYGRTFFSLDADAIVTLLAPKHTLTPEVAGFVDRGQITLLDRAFTGISDLEGYDVILGCSDDPEESIRIAEGSNKLRIPVNCADVPDLCDFYFVATLRDGPLQVGVSTNGCGPRLAARIRNMIREALPKATGEAVKKMGALRQRVKEVDPGNQSVGKRMSWLTKLSDQWTVEEMAVMGEDEVMLLLDAYERGDKVPTFPGKEKRGSGKSPAAVNGTSSKKLAPPATGTFSNVKTALSNAPSPIDKFFVLWSILLAFMYTTAAYPFHLASVFAGMLLSTATAAVQSVYVKTSNVTSKSLSVANHVGDIATTYSNALLETSKTKIQTYQAKVAEWVPAVSKPFTSVSGKKAGLSTDMVDAAIGEPSKTNSSQNLLFLVGAGPGDPGLLTLKAHHLLRRADVVISDQLVAAPILALVSSADKIRFVERKVAGRSDIAQLDANQMMLEELRKDPSGKRVVVRLKGGDPYLFGRGGEEVAFLRQHGFDAVVVPGISSCIAAPGSVGIPVTHRGAADQLLVLSGRGEGGVWPDIPEHSDRRTTVILMSVLRLAKLVEMMTGKAGYPLTLPAAVVEKGTCEGQRVVEGTLQDIVEKVEREKVGSPALLVVGKVCSVLKDIPINVEAAHAAISSEKLLHSQKQKLEVENEEPLAPAGPKWSNKMSIAVPLYRAATTTAKNSIRASRSLVSIIPAPLAPGATLQELKIPRRSDIVLEHMEPSQAEGYVNAEWIVHGPSVEAERRRRKGLGPHGKGLRAVTSEYPDKFKLQDDGDETILLYFHGGAYFMCSAATHRPMTSKLSQVTGCRILSVDYRLAPEHPFPLPLHDAISAWKYLVDPKDGSRKFRPNQIVLAGDSAGGGLAIALSLWIRDNMGVTPQVLDCAESVEGSATTSKDAPLPTHMPAGIVALAPWVDLTHSQPSFRLNDSDYLPSDACDPSHITPGVRSHYYTSSDELNSHPYVSPLFASDKPETANSTSKDLRLPPTLIQLGSRERLRDEGIMLAAQSFQNSPMRVEIYEDMVHIFQVFESMGEPMALQSWERIGEFVKHCAGSIPVVKADALPAPSSSSSETSSNAALFSRVHHYPTNDLPPSHTPNDPTVHPSSPGFLMIHGDGKVVNLGRKGALGLVEASKRELEERDARQKKKALGKTTNKTTTTTSRWTSSMITTIGLSSSSSPKPLLQQTLPATPSSVAATPANSRIGGTLGTLGSVVPSLLGSVMGSVLLTGFGVSSTNSSSSGSSNSLTPLDSSTSGSSESVLSGSGTAGSKSVGGGWPMPKKEELAFYRVI
ncbi:hypothetical protein HDV05_005002 [Chytridiales sp. JEL 0842]|nr:hypothetical protein HDV05_005002 [Chytridiales sp. JEL 0842]